MIYHYDVPFYSQLRDITAVEWRMEGCGIASLAMEIGFYKPNDVSVMKLLNEGVASGAYDPNGGWTHTGLAALAEKHGLVGRAYDFSKLKTQKAFGELKNSLNEGPVIASIYNHFDPKSTLGHLIVLTGFDDQFVYYNNPASTKEEKKIANNDFLRGWKKRFITVREASSGITKVASSTVDGSRD